MFPGAVTVPHIARFHPAPPPPPGRADIIDRHGKLLATTLDSPSLYADPRQIIDAAEVARKLVATLPGLDRAQLQAKLKSRKGFVWIKRHLTPDQEYAVNQLGIPGLQFAHEERRVYPYGSLLSHAIGYAGIDDNGLAGIERGLDNQLRGRQEPVQLSIDLRLQYILHEEMQRVFDDFTAKGAAGLIMNVNTGEVLAMVSLAGFRSEPSRYAGSEPSERSDRPADVQPGHSRRLRNRLDVQDFHNCDGARLRRYDDDRQI